MEPLYQKVEIANDVSFFMKDTFSPLFHFHMAYELILFRRGTGNAIIGNKTTDYKESSLFMLGPNLPHCFTSFDNNENMAFVIQVKREILEGLTDLIPEIGSIILMLEKSKYGLKFNQSIGSNYHNRINRLYKLDGLDRLMDLISMLHDLSKIKQVELLTSPETNLNVNLKEYDRINSVYEFVFKNFQNPIPLDNISSLLNITNIAFCRYFKKITQKTFVTYLNEYRIGHACKLLSTSDKGVSQIGFDSGFQSVANFNRQFKKIKGMSPNEYKKLRNRIE